MKITFVYSLFFTFNFNFCVPAINTGPDLGQRNRDYSPGTSTKEWPQIIETSEKNSNLD